MAASRSVGRRHNHFFLFFSFFSLLIPRSDGGVISWWRRCSVPRQGPRGGGESGVGRVRVCGWLRGFVLLLHLLLLVLLEWCASIRACRSTHPLAGLLPGAPCVPTCAWRTTRKPVWGREGGGEKRDVVMLGQEGVDKVERLIKYFVPLGLEMRCSAVAVPTRPIRPFLKRMDGKNE